MHRCSICGAEIESGTHHESTTFCIQILRYRIDALDSSGVEGPRPRSADTELRFAELWAELKRIKELGEAVIALAPRPG